MINFIVVHSTFETEESISARLGNYITSISNKTKSPGDYISSSPNVVKINSLNEKPLVLLVATGGTEQIVADIIKNSNLPVLMLAPNQKNAVAASLEIYSCYKHKKNILLKYINNLPQAESALENFIDSANAIFRINSAVFASIGAPSDWLLTSKNVNEFGNFNTNLLNIPTQELIDEVKEIAEDNPDLLRFLNDLEANTQNSIVEKGALIQSGKVYAALRKLVNKYKLNALSVRCFDLIDHNYTSCMGLSFLNDEGIIGGCEGDLHAAFSMMIGRYITGEPCWMANPSSIDFDENSIIFAHCSTPLKMFVPKTIHLDTHMESGLSVAVSGKLPKEDVTVFRTGDNFEKMIITTGKVITSNMGNDNLCRTQAIIQINGDLNKWLDSSLGNHQIIVYGDITEKLKTFCRLTDIEVIETE